MDCLHQPAHLDTLAGRREVDKTLGRMHSRLDRCQELCRESGFLGAYSHRDASWFRKVAFAKSYCKETVALACLCLARCHSAAAAKPPAQQDLASFVCLVLASKAHEPEPQQLRIQDVLSECGGVFSVAQAAAMEREVLEVLDWRVHVPTPLDLCRQLMAAVMCEFQEENEDGLCEEPDWQRLLTKAESFIDSSHLTLVPDPLFCPATIGYAAAVSAFRSQRDGGKWAAAAQDAILQQAQLHNLAPRLVNACADQLRRSLASPSTQRGTAKDKRMRKSGKDRSSPTGVADINFESPTASPALSKPTPAASAGAAHSTATSASAYGLLRPLPMRQEAPALTGALAFSGVGVAALGVHSGAGAAQSAGTKRTLLHSAGSCFVKRLRTADVMPQAAPAHS
eukprot:TRINITY_DN3576_c0_g1_i1.p1 TRINITY_DN3576_c0_g1~~TRINITY_DN3576_c0_g1_i1.p1  ORF type:complete len:397 (+),score=75.24 TRINITY_DN3576_c0_g1_i1:260-1450(+)